MSLENAILAHAAALTELAAAIRAGFGGAFAPVQLVAGTGEKIKGTVVATGQGSTGVKPDADLDKAVGKVEDDAKDAQAKAMAAVEEKKAKAKADAAAKKAAADKAAADAAASAASSQTDGADSSDDLDGDDGLGDDTPTLDYKNDVRPVLLDAMKRTDKPTVQALIKSYGVAKGEDIAPEHFADAIAKAKALGA